MSQTETPQGNTADRPYSRVDVVKIVQSVLSKVKTSEAPNQNLYQELEDLAACIEKIRAELAQSRPNDIKNHAIPAAADELDAVVGETAEATGTIMDACEALERAAENMSDEQKNTVTEQVTRIYEACGFQDITGQRISKVVKALKHIEEKVSEIIHALGTQEGQSDVRKETADTQDDDEKLLNGPALPSDGGVSQDEIDRLLAGFDK